MCTPEILTNMFLHVQWLFCTSYHTIWFSLRFHVRWGSLVGHNYILRTKASTFVISSTSWYWHDTGFVIKRESNYKVKIFHVLIYNVLHDFNFKCSTWQTFLVIYKFWNVSPPYFHPIHCMLLTAHSNQIHMCKKHG